MANVASLSPDMSNGGGEYGDKLPVDVCKLPSKGALYPKEHPLHMKEVVEFKSMTAHEENILATPALLKQGTVLNVLIQSCLINKSIDPLDLLIGDKAALLLAIRISGFDEEYHVKTSCGACHKTSPHTFYLNKARIKPLGAEPIRPGENLFEFKLPKSKKKVHFSLPIDRDDLEIMQIQDNRKRAFKNASIDTTITDRLNLSIKSIEGNKDPEYIAKFINRMPVKDSRSLRQYINKIEPDIQMKEEVNCRHCGERTSRNIPVGYEFFWPSNFDD